MSYRTHLLLNIFNTHLAYIQNWLKVLENDKRFIIRASDKAQRAVDYILGKISDLSLREEVEEVTEESLSV